MNPTPSCLLAAAALTAFGLLPLTGCTGAATTTEESSYQLDQPVTALLVDARAASVTIVVEDGPVRVTEKYRYSRSKPTTAHRVDGHALQLTESGCRDDNARCEVSYRIRVPKVTSAKITAQAGAVKVDGLAGDVHVTTEAGAVEAHALTSDQVTIRTDAGAASLEFAEAPTLVRTTTSVGAIELRVPGTTAYAVDVHTEVGGASVNVDKDPRSAHRIEVSTEVGGVKIDRLP
jgi:DUF4097 and DUF4098 domain-containing protein YvlB